MTTHTLEDDRVARSLLDGPLQHRWIEVMTPHHPSARFQVPASGRVKHRYEMAKAEYEFNKHKYLETKPAPKGSGSTKGGGQ